MRCKPDLNKIFPVLRRESAANTGASSQEPPDQAAISVGEHAGNPREGAKDLIRKLPRDIRLLFVEAASGPVSATAYAATLRIPAKRGTLTAFDLIRVNPRIALGNSPTITQLAKIIGQSSSPNAMRDALRAPRYGPPSLHPDILPLRHFASFDPANEYEYDQALELLKYDFSALERLGKGDEKKDLEALDKIRADFLRRDVNPNKHLHNVPSPSAVHDALVQGVASRLLKMKGKAKLDGARLISSLIKDFNTFHFRNGDAIGPDLWLGVSNHARVTSLSDVLRAIGARTLEQPMEQPTEQPMEQPMEQPTQEKILGSATNILGSCLFRGIAPKDVAKVAIELGRAIPDFDSEIEDHRRHTLAHKALTEFRALISGTPVKSDKGYRSVQPPAFTQAERANIIGAVAETLGKKTSSTHPRQIHGALGTRIRALTGQLRSLVRPSIEISMLYHMLETLHRPEDPAAKNVIWALDNCGAWPGLMKATAKLDIAEQNKIAKEFLHQLEESCFFTWHEDDGVEAMIAPLSSRFPPRTDVVVATRLAFKPAFEALCAALPDFEDESMKAELQKVLDRYSESITLPGSSQQEVLQ